MYKLATSYKINLKGYSLIEVMVAILILGTVFIGLVQAFPLASNIIKNAENKTKASYLAQEKIEGLYQIGYENFATGTIEVKHPLGDAGSDRALFQRETTSEYIDNALQNSITDQGM
ncbi:prepilin-type N-terminal cleavage/methylation domain-containing protein, partial [Candidatus Parcubacteria bacterium]|nr:prepilin-type N-terminal cleavage/methylation domain-containing protein [Candidatus Parcubacteria bacterium]